VSTSPLQPRPVPALSLGEAVERLQRLTAIEDFSSLHGTPCLIVDFDRGVDRGVDREDARLCGRAAKAAIRVLERLACPSIAMVRGDVGDAGASSDVAGLQNEERAALLARFDVVIERPQDLPALVAQCRHRPLAALALVQLLRHSEGRGIHDGLVAESFVYSTLQAGPEFAEWLASRAPRQVGVAEPVGAGPAVSVVRDGEDGRRLRLSLNRPQKRNAFSTAMRDALAEGLSVAIADPSIREVRLDGSGPGFCSGGDLDEFGTLPDPATAHAVRSTRNVARLLAECGDRVQAFVHGACVGAGIEVPAFAARVVAREDAFFELPECQLGLVPGAGGTVSIARRIGRQRTAWMALSGARVDAQTALRWGLVDEVRDFGDGSEGERG